MGRIPPQVPLSPLPSHLEDASRAPLCDEVRPGPRARIEPGQADEDVHLLEAVGADILHDRGVLGPGERGARDNGARGVGVPAGAERGAVVRTEGV